MSKNPGKYTKKTQVWMEEHIYEICVGLVEMGLYRSLAELMRDGMNMVIEKSSGYEEARQEEAASMFSPDAMVQTKIKIDGTLMRMRVNARWWHLYAANQLKNLIDDLHIPQPLSAIEEKYGTRIELYNMHEAIVTDEDAYKETHAYKQEHGLLDNPPPVAED